MSCEGKETCPIHGAEYMKMLRVSTDGSEPYCAGCHAGEMAARQEYESGVIRGLRDARTAGEKLENV